MSMKMRASLGVAFVVLPVLAFAQGASPLVLLFVLLGLVIMAVGRPSEVVG